jgi:hypothetical protein
MILEFSAGTDHGANAKTKRRKNSARHEELGDKIKICNYHMKGVKKKAGQGLCKQVPQAFSPSRYAPPCRTFTR